MAGSEKGGVMMRGSLGGNQRPTASDGRRTRAREGDAMSAPAAGLTPVNVAAEAVPSSTVPSASLPTYRLNIMRIGYLVMGIGLALVKWPLFFRDGGLASLPVFEGVLRLEALREGPGSAVALSLG